jgi:hypothetical protein
LRLWRHTHPARLWFTGCSGGSGESTLAALLPGARPTEHRWPVIPGAPARVVLVARTSAEGLLAAQDVIAQWADPASGLRTSIDLLGLVLSADIPGRPPRVLRDLAKHVRGGVPKDRSWELPYIEAWRLGERHRTSDVARVLARITALLPRPTEGELR